jgi:hypothetical protein
MRIVKRILLCMVLVAFASPLFAEDNPPENMQILVEKIRADKKLLVAENMQLSEKESKAFWPVYEKYQSELFLIRVRTVKLINDYAENYEKMTNGTAKKLIDEYLTIETLRLKLAKAYLPEFRKALPDTKVARYYQIENKINAALYSELATKIPLLKTEAP